MGVRKSVRRFYAAIFWILVARLFPEIRTVMLGTEVNPGGLPVRHFETHPMCKRKKYIAPPQPMIRRLFFFRLLPIHRLPLARLNGEMNERNADIRRQTFVFSPF